MPKEYIEREELFERFERYSSGFVIEDDYDTALTIIHGAPIDDELVEVVRCEKCKFGEYDEEENKILCIRMKNIGDGELYVFNEPTDYCSYGERKDGAE